MTTLPEIPQQPNQIETLGADFSGSVFNNLNYLRSSINTTDGVSNFIETELPESSLDDSLAPESIVRNGSGSQIIGMNDREAFFDGGYHIRSYGVYDNFSGLREQFLGRGGGITPVNLPESNANYIDLSGRGIVLPTFNARLPIDMTMVLERTSTNIPEIYFRPSRIANRVITVSDGTYQLAKVDTSFMDDSPFTRNITRAIRTGNIFTLRVQLTLRTAGNTFLLLENGDGTGANNIENLPRQGTYLANFRPLENGDADITSHPRDYTVTPSINNCRLHYLDCLVGNRLNRRTL